MDDGTKTVIGIIVVILLIIFGVNKCDDNKKEKMLEERNRIEAQTQYQTCPYCYGNKYVYDPNYGYNVLCPVCFGSGQVEVPKNGNQPSFTGRKYDCERCLCPGYKRTSTFNSDCKICGHPKSWHYSQQ